MIHILLVDDHPSVMEGTKVILEQEEDMKVFLAHNAEKAMELLKIQSFDIMLFDMHMPATNGIELAKQVISMIPEARILIYTGFEFSNHFNLMIEAGISGFVLKTANRDQLVSSIRCALRGEVILPLSLVKQLRRTSIQTFEAHSNSEALAITSKEYEILVEIAKGKTNKEIAKTLIMSQRALEYSLTQIFHKLKVKSRIEAVMKAKNMGL